MVTKTIIPITIPVPQLNLCFTTSLIFFSAWVANIHVDMAERSEIVPRIANDAKRLNLMLLLNWLKDRDMEGVVKKLVKIQNVNP